ncbi:hypothetical protein FKP32DRAFT_267611 [Trametes sanguinea]|nr:hypothetical protein FKP32DRAFT_267611 [Trametes sanguinea]
MGRAGDMSQEEESVTDTRTRRGQPLLAAGETQTQPRQISSPSCSSLLPHPLPSPRSPDGPVTLPDENILKLKAKSQSTTLPSPRPVHSAVNRPFLIQSMSISTACPLLAIRLCSPATASPVYRSHPATPTRSPGSSSHHRCGSGGVLGNGHARPPLSSSWPSICRSPSLVWEAAYLLSILLPGWDLGRRLCGVARRCARPRTLGRNPSPERL